MSRPIIELLEARNGFYEMVGNIQSQGLCPGRVIAIFQDGILIHGDTHISPYEFHDTVSWNSNWEELQTIPPEPIPLDGSEKYLGHQRVVELLSDLKVFKD